MSKGRRVGRLPLVVAAIGLLGAGVAAGCGAAGIGLGSLGVALVAGLAWLALAATSTTGCSPRPSTCLTPQPTWDAGSPGPDVTEPPPGPCLQPYLGPCLQQPYVGPCLEQAAPPAEDAVGPCLKELPPDETCVESTNSICLSEDPTGSTCLLITPFCLSPDYHNLDAGESPDAAAPPPEVCLEFEPPHPCLSVPYRPAPSGKTSSAAGAAAAGERLAAAGVLSPDQLRRLARLRGER